MNKIVVAYHSGYGHTKRQAEAVAADAIVFGAPTYMGSLSAAFKTFMEASSRVWGAQGWQDKLAAGFTCSASQSDDKLNALQQLAVFAAQHGMLWVSLGLLPGNNSAPARCRISTASAAISARWRRPTSTRVPTPCCRATSTPPRISASASRRWRSAATAERG